MKKITPVFGPQELFNGAANCDEYLVAVQHSVGQKTKVSFYPSLVEAFNYVVDFPPRGVVFHRAAIRKIEEVPDSQLVTDGMPSFYVGSSGACTHKMAESDIPVWCNDVDDTCTAMGFINDCLRLTRKPNRWTIADQKAGRLPEVGCLVDFCHKLNTKWRTGEIKYIDNQVAVIKADDIDRPFVYDFNRVEFKPIEPPEEKAPHWIPVGERLPDAGVLCIVFGANGVVNNQFEYYKQGHIKGYFGSVVDGCVFELTGVTHWVPLPSAPEQNK